MESETGNPIVNKNREYSKMVQNRDKKGLVVRNIENVSIEIWRCVEIGLFWITYSVVIKTANISIKELFSLFTY